MIKVGTVLAGHVLDRRELLVTLLEFVVAVTLLRSVDDGIEERHGGRDEDGLALLDLIESRNHSAAGCQMPAR
jgi:hypothetical protein